MSNIKILKVSRGEVDIQIGGKELIFIYRNGKPFCSARISRDGGSEYVPRLLYAAAVKRAAAIFEKQKKRKDKK